MPIISQQPKLCHYCGKEKPYGEFCIRKRSWRPLCKDCRDRRAERSRERSRERNRENYRKWITKNPERAKELWRKNFSNRDPSKLKALKHRRHTRKRGNGGSFTSTEWQALCTRYDYRCLACGEQKPLTPDHIIPVSKGGTGYISNIQPLCGSCNSRKGTKTTDYRDKDDRF